MYCSRFLIWLPGHAVGPLAVGLDEGVDHGVDDRGGLVGVGRGHRDLDQVGPADDADVTDFRSSWTTSPAFWIRGRAATLGLVPAAVRTLGLVISCTWVWRNGSRCSPPPRTPKRSADRGVDPEQAEGPIGRPDVHVDQPPRSRPSRPPRASGPATSSGGPPAGRTRSDSGDAASRPAPGRRPEGRSSPGAGRRATSAGTVERWESKVSIVGCSCREVWGRGDGTREAGEGDATRAGDRPGRPPRTRTSRDIGRRLGPRGRAAGRRTPAIARRIGGATLQSTGARATRVNLKIDAASSHQAHVSRGQRSSRVRSTRNSARLGIRPAARSPGSL